MRNLILIGLAAFFLMMAATVSVMWWTRSIAVKKQVETMVESFNTGLKNKDSSLTYESISVSGFPFTMNVTIAKPHFAGRMDKILDDPKIKESLGIKALPEWSEDIAIDGKVVFGVDALSNKFKLEVIGGWVTKGNIAGKIIETTSQADGGNVCELQLKGGGIFGDLWNFNIISNDGKEAAKSFRSLDCVTSSGKSINSSTKEALVNFGGGRLFVSRTPKNDVSDIRFYLNAKDFEVTKAYDEIASMYGKVLNQNNAFKSTVGKVNVDIDLSYSGTEDFKNPNAKNLPLDIAINKFHIADNSYQTDSNLHITNNISGGIRNVALTYKTEITATELFRNIFKERLHAVVDTVVSGATPESPEVKEKLTSLSSEAVDSLINSIVPDFASLGKMVAAVEANYTGDESFSEFKANLTALELSASPYGIMGTGAVKHDKNMQIPAGNLSITCRNCLKMIDDGMAYFTRLVIAGAVLEPSKFASVSVPAETTQAIKNFLLALQTSPDNKIDLKFDIVGKETNEATINGKSTAEVMALFNQTIVPALQHH